MITYDLSQHVAGDTWAGIPLISISRNSIPLDLTGATADFKVKYQIDAPTLLHLSANDGSIITLSPAISGNLQIPPRIVDIPPATYIWSLKVTLASGEIDTFASGRWPIIKTA